jgi:protein-export membrane protein SecD
VRHQLKFRWAVIVIAVAAAIWYLWPTVRLYSMSEAEREAVRLEDPDAFDRLRERAIQLGLDLQGGMHLVLELDESQRAFSDDERRDAIDRALEIIRNRVDQFGVAEPLIQKIGDERIIVELPGIEDEERAKELVQRTAFLEFRLVPGEDVVLSEVRAIDAALAGRVLAPSPGDTTAGRDTTAARDTTAVQDTAAARDTTAVQDTAPSLGEILGGTAATDAPSERPFSSLLTSQPVGTAGQVDLLVEEGNVERVRAMLVDSQAMTAVDPGYEWLWGPERPFADGRTYRYLYLVEKQAQLTGEVIADAAAGFDTQLGSQPVVTLQMTPEGASVFGDVTGQHVNERLAIVLDGIVRMAPNIVQRIQGGNAQIEGFDSIEEARDISIVLRAGALPAPLDIIEERTVGPSLGADSIQKSRVAGILAMLVVALFMVAYYRGSGMVANLALALNIGLVLAALAAFGATLTLPGIAGLILTAGMAVDANVLIFERIREEVELGKSVRAAIDAGYSRAFVTILDAQITTLIAAAVLFQFGTGPIKGFAVVLTIGIISSIFTAVFVTHTIYETWTRTRPARRLSI